jgi:hypothetical protein
MSGPGTDPRTYLGGNGSVPGRTDGTGTVEGNDVTVGPTHLVGCPTIGTGRHDV